MGFMDMLGSLSSMLGGGGDKEGDSALTGKSKIAGGLGAIAGNIGTLRDGSKSKSEKASAGLSMGAGVMGGLGGIFDMISGKAAERGNNKLAGAMQIASGGAGALGSIATIGKAAMDIKGGNKLGGAAGIASGVAGALGSVSNILSGSFAMKGGVRKAELEQKESLSEEERKELADLTKKQGRLNTLGKVSSFAGLLSGAFGQLAGGAG